MTEKEIIDLDHLFEEIEKAKAIFSASENEEA